MKWVAVTMLYATGVICTGCGSDTGDSGCDDGSGKEPGTWRPPAVACTPAPPAHVEPTQGVSFDPAHMPCIQIEMDPADYALLKRDTTFGHGLCLDDVFETFSQIVGQCGAPWPKEYSWYPARVTADGVSLDQVGVRRKGFIGSLYSPVPALKIKTDRFVDDQFLGDTERITLNNNAGDATHMAGCLIYEIFAAAGHPAPRCNLANVMVNGQPLGPYTHVEAIKKRFLERVFGDSTGSLYEGTLADFVEAWLPRWEVKTDDTDTTFAPLLAVSRALQKSDDELMGALEPLLNIDRFLTFWALEVLVSHGDGHNNSRNNFYVYFDPTDQGRAVFIPWGFDKTPAVDTLEPLGHYLLAEVPRRLSRIPALNKRMTDELQRLIDEVWDEEAFLASIDRFGTQVKTAQQDEGYDGQVQDLRNWVKGRPGIIALMLSDGLPAGDEQSASCLDSKSKGGKDDPVDGVDECTEGCVEKGGDAGECESSCLCYEECLAGGGELYDCLVCFAGK